MTEKPLNILLLSVYPFNSLDDGYICADLAKTLTDHRHTVTVITPAKDIHVKKSFIQYEDTCTHIHIACGAIQKVGAVQKLIALHTLEVLSIKALRTYAKDSTFDLVITMISHCAFLKTVRFIKKRDAPIVYNLLKDIFPQNAVDMGMISKKSFVYTYFRKKEEIYYKISDYIGAISPKNVDIIRTNNPYFSSERVEVNPNSIIPRKLILSDADKKEIKKKYGIPLDKPVFIYGGNLGKPQGIDFVLACIAENEQKDWAHIIIAGSGTEYDKMRDFFDRRNIKKSSLFSSIPHADFQVLTQACDVGLVFLDARFTIPNYPSRILSYMEASLPILCAVDAVCDAGTIAQENGYGYTCLSGDLHQFALYAALLADNESLRAAMGKRAYEYLLAQYTTEKTYEIIMCHFKLR